MSQQYIFNPRKRKFQGVLHIVYKIVSGFVFGAGIAGLFYVSVASLLPILMAIGGLFAILYGVKESLNVYRRYQLEKFLAARVEQEDNQDTPYDFDYGPKQRTFRKFLTQFYVGNKVTLKVLNALFSVVTFAMILALANPLVFGTLTLTSVVICAALAISSILSLVHVYQTSKLKARINNIERWIGPLNEVNRRLSRATLQNVNVFANISKKERYVYAYLYPLMSGLVHTISSTGTVFGLVVLLGIDFGLMLPVVALPTLVAVAIGIGLVAGVIAAFKTFETNQHRIRYINYCHIEYRANKDESRILTFNEYMEQETQLKKRFNPYKEPTLRNKLIKAGEKAAKRIAPMLETLRQVLDGAGVGTGLVIAAFTILAAFSILVNPLISLGLIIILGTTFAAVNVYRIQQAKAEQRSETYNLVQTLQKKMHAHNAEQQRASLMKNGTQSAYQIERPKLAQRSLDDNETKSTQKTRSVIYNTMSGRMPQEQTKRRPSLAHSVFEAPEVTDPSADRRLSQSHL